MGLSTSVASVILLIAIIGSATVLYSVFSATQELLREAESVKTELEYEQLHTFITIENVTYNSTSGILVINATNNGSTVILVDDIEVLLDGQIFTQDIMSATVNGVKVDLWLPGETLKIEVNSSINPSRVKIVAHNGVSAYWEG